MSAAVVKPVRKRARKAARILKVYGVLDPWGGAGQKPDDEMEHTSYHLGLFLGVKVENLGHAEDFQNVPATTDVLFFDFGGVAGGYGPNPFADRCNEARTWAEDHPSSLVLVVSSFTWERGGFRKGDWDELMGRHHEPPPANILPLHDFRSSHDELIGAIATWLGIAIKKERGK